MPEITIYTSSLCGYCHRAKSLLNSKSVAYHEISVDGDPARREEMMELSQQRTVPQIFIDTQHIGGCDDLHQLEREGVLDSMLSINDSD